MSNRQFLKCIRGLVEDLGGSVRSSRGGAEVSVRRRIPTSTRVDLAVLSREAGYKRIVLKGEAYPLSGEIRSVVEEKSYE